MLNIWCGAEIRKLLSLDAEPRTKLLDIEVGSVLHAYSWLHLILDVVPVLALDLPEIVQFLNFVLRFELSTNL